MLHGGFVEAYSSPKLTTKSFRKDVGNIAQLFEFPCFLEKITS